MSIGQIFSHNKRPGHLYRVIGVAIDCTNGEREGQQLIIYKRANPDNQEVARMTFAREVTEFMSHFTKYGG
jgi:hypothetical protein